MLIFARLVFENPLVTVPVPLCHIPEVWNLYTDVSRFQRLYESNSGIPSLFMQREVDTDF
jgi:hypothetical protein